MVKKRVDYEKGWHALALTRILLGFVFLWAFVDKTFGLGYATEPAKAWVNGGSPTAGFLMGASHGTGPFAGLFKTLSDMPGVDALFMFGLLGLGVSLILGVCLRISAIAGTTMLVLMWMAALPLDNNPVIDEHIIYAAVLWTVALSRREWSLTDWWLSIDTVKKNKWLW